ncbi:hypothetical protein AVEN_104180-1 [Araneus ventricosus]|uniref:Uncharacterized protein n=1 Tax=Araneus ventricosus TaxID=182803 RepID=A0A4Y2PQV3_ARAVE|nr:hypothetical protein AVEN_104180-1 [Araneus ventricosus]
MQYTYGNGNPNCLYDFGHCSYYDAYKQFLYTINWHLFLAGKYIEPPRSDHYLNHCPSSKMSSAIERPFIETRSHNDRPMNVFLSDSDGFSSGIAPKCLIGHRSADHRYRMSFAGRYDRKPSSVVSWR